MNKQKLTKQIKELYSNPPKFHRTVHVFMGNNCIAEVAMVGYIIDLRAKKFGFSFHITDDFDGFQATLKSKTKRRKK